MEDLSSSADVLEEDDGGGLRHVQGFRVAGHGDVQPARIFEFGHARGLAAEDDRAAVEEVLGVYLETLKRFADGK